MLSAPFSKVISVRGPKDPGFADQTTFALRLAVVRATRLRCSLAHAPTLQLTDRGGHATKGIHDFISYSHQDEQWKERLLSHLRVLQRQGAADIWDTGDIQSGADWAKEIEKAIHQSDIVVLLISPSFLASDFIMTKELPALLERRHKEGVPVVPILA